MQTGAGLEGEQVAPFFIWLWALEGGRGEGFSGKECMCLPSEIINAPGPCYPFSAGRGHASRRSNGFQGQDRFSSAEVACEGGAHHPGSYHCLPHRPLHALRSCGSMWPSLDIAQFPKRLWAHPENFLGGAISHGA
eukprot:803535-Pelagomonas_calceolata.AAC.2